MKLSSTVRFGVLQKLQTHHWLLAIPEPSFHGLYTWDKKTGWAWLRQKISSSDRQTICIQLHFTQKMDPAVHDYI